MRCENFWSLSNIYLFIYSVIMIIFTNVHLVFQTQYLKEENRSWKNVVSFLICDAYQVATFIFAFFSISTTPKSSKKFRKVCIPLYAIYFILYTMFSIAFIIFFIITFSAERYRPFLIYIIISSILGSILYIPNYVCIGVLIHEFSKLRQQKELPTIEMEDQSKQSLLEGESINYNI